MSRAQLPKGAEAYMKAPQVSIKSRSSPKEKRRESPSGWHYYALYKSCPRKWYLKYILGLRPNFTKPPLIFGGAMHEAVDAYYKAGFAIDTLMETFQNELYARKEEYEKPMDFVDDLEKGHIMLDTWASTWRTYDMEEIEIIETEKQYEILLGPEESQYVFTVRPDRVIRRKSDGRIVIPDVKTTGYSVDKSIQNAKMDDQLTSYVWAWNKTHPGDKCDCAQVDVIYKRKSVSKAERSEDIIIGDFAQMQFEMGLYGLITEITQKALSLDTYPWPLLFPRNGRECGLFGCEYEPICRQNITPDTPVVGFTKDPWVEVDEAIEKAQSWDFKRWAL